MNSFEIDLHKESFKFSGSHFTIFSKTSAERLHGHNYYVRVRVEVMELDPKLGMAFDFNVLKPHVRDLCDELDERVLIPDESPYLKLKKSKKEIEVQFQDKRYVFPLSDCKLLPVANITTEELSRLFCERLKKKLPP
ncbi:MAG: 6-carboxytetrahydropterin synthase, partial [Bdellovibrionales bacterium]|nr:6-carboxytetrahydropterin synthase [Bdellovibrionales bacterium]